MINLLNFGDSPFYFLFVLVATIFGLVLLLNALAFIGTWAVDRRTRALLAAMREGKK